MPLPDIGPSRSTRPMPTRPSEHWAEIETVRLPGAGSKCPGTGQSAARHSEIAAGEGRCRRATQDLTARGDDGDGSRNRASAQRDGEDDNWERRFEHRAALKSRQSCPELTYFDYLLFHFIGLVRPSVYGSRQRRIISSMLLQNQPGRQPARPGSALSSCCFPSSTNW